MYKLTDNELVTISKEIPSPGTAGEQVFISNSNYAVLGFQISLSQQDWTPSNRKFDLGGSGESFAILNILSPTYNIWTPYCQEGLGRHPLTQKGLNHFDVFEIENSIFSEEGAYFERKHYVFQFEDSTLDLVCKHIEVFLYKGSIEKMEKKVTEMYLTHA